jgi:beta-phosphoglucomutase-like phosphatase (HAD superfamily)
MRTRKITPHATKTRSRQKSHNIQLYCAARFVRHLPVEGYSVPLKAVFLDIDGTLVDSNEFHVMAWEEAFRDSGHLISREKIRGQIGKGADQLIPALTPGLDKQTSKTISDRHGEQFRLRYLQQVKAFARATDLIELLHVKGKSVILASSAEGKEVEHYVGELKIGAMLTGTVSKDDVMNSKPAGDIFAAALAQVFPMAASECLAIGDSPYDVESALRSGVRTIGLRSGGFSAERLAEAGAIGIYASVKELFDHYDRSPLQ